MNRPEREVFDALAASGAFLFGQGDRLLKLRIAASVVLSGKTLLPHCVQGEEALSTNYCYRLDCLSANAYLELKDLLGAPLELSILLPDGGRRLLTGLVTRAEHQGADGGFARYRLIVEPALATLAHRRNSRVFQDKSVPEIVAAVLDEHIAANPVFTRSFQYRAQLSATYPPRSYCLQYRESDLAFIERLLFEEGISYRYTHGPDAQTSLQDEDAIHEMGEAGVEAASDTPLHTLILFDANHTLPRDAEDAVRFHRTDGVETDDAIDSWTGSRQIESGRTQLASFDYKAVSTQSGSEETRIEQGDDGGSLHSSLEDYDPQTLYYGSDPGEIGRYGKLRQQAKDLASKTFSGEGSVRRLIPGTWFELAEHPLHDQDAPEDREFIVTSLAFEAENNLTREAKQGLAGLLGEPRAAKRSAGQAEGASEQNRPPYRNRFTAVRRHIAIVPQYDRSAHQKPTAGGMTTVTVVGPAGEEIFTDAHGRIKIQFHWQRRQDHPQGGADFDDRSSTWVRVAMQSAGAAWGTSYIPRIGQEVLVTFLENDIDRPLVTGVVYNGTHRPPTFSGAGSLPANKTLSGVKSKEYKGSRYNELVFDDSTNEVRAKLSSEHGKTQLNQGFLIHPRSEGKGSPRGEGFELRTDESGALRAAKGLLFSAWQRANAEGKQLDRNEALVLMENCLELFKQLGEYAAQHQALALDPGPQGALKQAFIDWENGSNTAPGKVPEGGAPVIGMSAPAGLSFTTPESVVSYAGNNFDSIAQRHLQLTAGQRLNANAGKGISLFSHADGIKVIAHYGPLLLQSQHDSTEVNAEQDIKLTASEGKIVAFAQKEIVLAVAGGAGIRIDEGDVEITCPGRLTVKAATHHWDGPGSMAVDLPAFTAGPTDQKFVLKHDPHDELAQPIANVPYEIEFTDGSTVKGVSDAEGKTELLARDAMRIADIRFYNTKKSS